MGSSGSSKDHNLCRACDQDFGSLQDFDNHRKTYRIDVKQKLSGYCLPPESLGLVEYNGAWYTEENKAKVVAAVARLKSSRE